MEQTRTNRDRSAHNKARHWETRTQWLSSMGAKGSVLGWAERARGLAAHRAAYGDLSMWAEMAAVLEAFCDRYTPAEPADRRAARRLHHWEQRRDQLDDDDPRGKAGAWWDRARAVATDHARREGDEVVWNDLTLTLQNLSDRYSR